ncbi:hypothetical protein JHK85_027859 [Glycine max]|nr:hypothetical protein JHK85_027859 [Glycine max]
MVCDSSYTTIIVETDCAKAIKLVEDPKYHKGQFVDLAFEIMKTKMSLYIGNLSEHSRRDDLERVFRRFGHCNVQLKRNGYGFVVFDFPLDAEKALRALKGRNICGESLTLTWSSKQPSSHFSRIPSGVRRNAYELGHARNAERVGYARRRMGTNGRSNQKMGRGKSVEMAGEERGYCRDDFKDYVGEKKNYEGDFPNEGGGVVPNKEENGGWGEPVHDPLVDNGNGSGIEFDRYEPYQCPDRKHDNEDYHVGYSGGSPAAHSQENVSRALGEDTSNCSNGSKFQQNCFRCGDAGHKMRNCPKEHTSQRKYNSKIVQQNNKIDKKHKSEDENKFESDSLARLQSSVEALSMRHQIDGRRLSGSRHHHAPRRNESSPVTRETDKHNKKEYGGKKRSRNEIELPKQSKAKISKQSVSSSLLSDYSASRFHSNSQSSKSLHRSSSHSRSRSVSSRSYSSSSKSQYCKGKRLNSRRLSSSMPLCVSLNQTLSSSPNKIQLNSKGSSINGTALESVEHLVAQGQQIGSKMELENLQSKDTGIAVNGKAAVYTTVVDDVEKGQFVQEDNHENHFFLKSSGRVTDLNEPLVGNLSPTVEKETKEIEKPASETNVNLHSNLSTIVSTEEIRMVLNTYGLELPKDDENNLTIDAVFGCARLWPWHVVYYRRLKKGPISTENYARRVAQNQEFGIVDKYIRSSSGWGEFSLENA